MRLNDFTQFFDNPKVSVFNRSQDKDFPLRIGRFIPTRWDLLNFGNSAKTYSGHKMRLSPMLAPNFSNIKLEEHAAVVPLRIIMQDYENTFNYATNLDGSSLPHFGWKDYHEIIRAVLLTGRSLTGSLFDYCGFPIYSDLFKSIVASQNSLYLATDTGRFSFLHTSFTDIDNFQSFYDLWLFDQISYEGFINYRGFDLLFEDVASGVGRYKFQPFFVWLINKVSASDDEDSAIEAYKSMLDRGFSDLPSYVAFVIDSTVSRLTDQYLNYLFSKFLGSWLFQVNENFDEDNNSITYTTLPLRAYLRVYMDWLTNGNFFDREQFLSYIYDFEDMMISKSVDIITDPEADDSLFDLLYPVNRLWDYDYFTSLLPTAKADNAIEIPANSTVLDLAKLTAIQKLVLRLSYSSRYRDVVWNVFKIKPSDARLQQSSIISERIHNIGIGEAIQTSETTTSSVLGSYAGRGYSSGNNKGYHIFCEEPCIVFDFVSLTAIPSYRDALHPLIHVDDIMDLPIPDMDVLGNTPVYSDIVSGNVLDSKTILGYGRQYQEWLYNFNTVHGEFRTSMDYWQLTRSFDNTPVINDDFLRMNDKEDFDAIFSIVDAPHAQLSIYYRSLVTRHVHRSVRIIV